ncbi:MAG: exodeoxyribonuclease VII large subunit [Candidatus Mycalebacterium zealandia]|nr:MAG: exodeoxyribonuclease VII large subunit [Candidatus Mycalebacterium zealandia]
MSEKLSSFDDFTDDKIYGVSELNAVIGSAVRDAGGGFVWVEGEITDFIAHRSGHWYFSLRDEKSEIRAACWKQNTFKIGFVPENGMKVLCRCQTDFYEQRGTVNLSILTLEPRGAGAEALALKQLLAKLEKEGLFAPERKQPTPFLCRKIGVVTAPSSAALADIVKVARGRFPNLEITVSPASVQGGSAPAEIALALGRLEKTGVDVIIVARGGGGGEDLSAFNTEIVARAVADCSKPVVSAVGHETDITASDLAADLRAATPSAAAEMVVAVKADLVEGLEETRRRLGSSLVNALSYAAMEIDAVSDSLVRAARSRLAETQYELSALALRLDGLSPLATLERGYSVAYAKSDKPVTDASSLREGDELKIRFARGTALAEVKKLLK